MLYWKHHYFCLRTCAQSSTRMLLNLADSSILPYNLRRLPYRLRSGLNALNGANVTGLSEVLAPLNEAVEEFAQAADRFMNNLNEVDLSDAIKLRIINDQLMQLERVWIMPGGIPGRPEVRHAIFAPAKFNKWENLLSITNL